MLNEYELYQGEEYLGQGTAAELAEKLNIPQRSIYSFASSEFHNRQDAYSRAKIAFKADEEIKVEEDMRIKERVDEIVKLYFKGYDLKTLLKTI